LKKNFDVDEVFNLSKINGVVPLEMYFLDSRKHMYITTTNPSLSHTFDLSRNASKPKLGKSLVIGQGAHHVGLTRDRHYGFVQKSLHQFSRHARRFGFRRGSAVAKGRGVHGHT